MVKAWKEDNIIVILEMKQTFILYIMIAGTMACQYYQEALGMLHEHTVNILLNRFVRQDRSPVDIDLVSNRNILSKY